MICPIAFVDIPLCHLSGEGPLKEVLGVEPDYLLCFRALVSVEFGPNTPTGGCGGDSPSTIATGGSRWGRS